MAAALQARTEEVGVHMARHLQQQTGLKKICMAGGVALNCVMNTRILTDTDFEDIYIQPASYDAGGMRNSFSIETMPANGRLFIMDGPCPPGPSLERTRSGRFSSDPAGKGMVWMTTALPP